MPDWRARIRAELAARGRVADPDVVEELGMHADAAWDRWQAEGVPGDDLEPRMARLIEVWASEAPDLARRPTRLGAATPPPARAPWFVGLAQDVRYGLAMLRRQPGAT